LGCCFFCGISQRGWGFCGAELGDEGRKVGERGVNKGGPPPPQMKSIYTYIYIIYILIHVYTYRYTCGNINIYSYDVNIYIYMQHSFLRALISKSGPWGRWAGARRAKRCISLASSMCNTYCICNAILIKAETT